jgi:hypothetical protein
MAVKSLSRSGLQASDATNSMLAGYPDSDFELISTAIVSNSSTASVTFALTADQQAKYRHLQVRAVVRSGINVNGDDHQLQFNGDTTYTNYRSHYLYGSGSAVTSATLQSTQFPGINLSINTADSSHTTAVFGGAIVDIIDAFSTIKNKVVRCMSGMAQAGTANYGVTLTSGIWLSTNSISSLKFYPYPGTSPVFAIGTRYSLYGVK